MKFLIILALAAVAAAEPAYGRGYGYRSYGGYRGKREASDAPNVPFGGYTTAYSNINPGPVAGPLTPAYGDSVATPKGLRSLSLEGFSEDLNQDGFVDPIAPAVAAPAVTYAAAPVVTYAAAPAVTYAAAPALAAYGAYPYAAAYGYAALPIAPQPVVDTPEVAAAKADFFAKFEEAKARSKRDASLRYRSYGGYRGYGGYRSYGGRRYGYRG